MYVWISKNVRLYNSTNVCEVEMQGVKNLHSGKAIKSPCYISKGYSIKNRKTLRNARIVSFYILLIWFCISYIILIKVNS